MAKKTRKQSRAKSRSQRPSQVTQPTLIAKTTAPSKKAASTAIDLAEEYNYVFADLRKIAVIAVVMFALLFGLAFILR
jgi:hypothetical protein